MPLRPVTVVVLAALVAYAGAVTVDEPRALTVPTRTPMKPDHVPKTCPITKPPARPFIPPPPFPPTAAHECFWFGTEKLWTQLRGDGTWKGLPHYTPDDYSLHGASRRAARIVDESSATLPLSDYGRVAHHLPGVAIGS